MLDQEKGRKLNSLPQQIAEDISEKILTGALKPGDKIVEATLSEQYDMSRAPIREALYLLEMEGLVMRIPRRGTIVKGYTEDEMHDLLEIRMVLEQLSMKKIEKVGIDQNLLNTLEQLVNKSESLTDNTVEYSKLNREFHTLLVSMSKSDILKNNYRRLGTPLLTLQRMSLSSKESIQQSIKGHRQIVESLKAGDIKEAKHLLDKHNDVVFDRIDFNE